MMLVVAEAPTVLGKPVACTSRLFSLNNGLLCGRVADYAELIGIVAVLLGFSGNLRSFTQTVQAHAPQLRITPSWELLSTSQKDICKTYAQQVTMH